MFQIHHIALTKLIAKIIATLYLSIGVGLLVNGSFYRKELVKLLDNLGFLLLDGVLCMVSGYVILWNHDSWDKGLPMLTTLLGYGLLIRGVFILAFPKFIAMFKPLLQEKDIHKLITPLVFVMGGIFAYFGFWA